MCEFILWPLTQFKVEFFQKMVIFRYRPVQINGCSMHIYNRIIVNRHLNERCEYPRRIPGWVFWPNVDIYRAKIVKNEKIEKSQKFDLVGPNGHEFRELLRGFCNAVREVFLRNKKVRILFISVIYSWNSFIFLFKLVSYFRKKIVWGNDYNEFVGLISTNETDVNKHILYHVQNVHNGRIYLKSMCGRCSATQHQKNNIC